jgi:hypothetical protein
MGECDLFGMQVQPIIGQTVQIVSFDGCSQTFGMGSVNSKLMGSAGHRKKVNAAFIA